MTPRQRVLTAIAHQQPDRVPIALAFAPEVEQRLQQHLGLNAEAFGRWTGNDLVPIVPAFPGRAGDLRYADPTIELTDDGLYLDIWRVPFRPVQTDGQQYMELAGRPPLADCESVADLDRFPWPDPDDWDYATISGDLSAAGEMAVWAHSRGFFEIAHFMRGMGSFLTDLALRPELACALMDRIGAFLLARSRRILEAGGGRFDLFEYNDDVAGQRGLFISPGMWREFIKPRVVPFCELGREFGAKVRYHCCGAVRPIIEDLIEIGIDVLNPFQPLAAGMDPFALKRDFGDRITFDGGIDIQDLLPNAAPEEVRRHVRKMIDVVGRSGGYFLGGSHHIQSDAPTANLIALVDEANGR